MSREAASRQALSDAYVEFAVSRLGVPASVGRILVALLLSSVPLSQAQLRASLALSEGSVSEGLRFLAARGFVERAGDPRARPAFYQVRAAGWADPAHVTMENARATLAMALLARQHFEEFDVGGPSFELIARTQAMFEVLVDELPALMEKALEAGARVPVGEEKRAKAG